MDAIERGDYVDLREELGDLLFQVIFYTQIANEEERFTLDDVISRLVAKLIRRHPHVFPLGDLYSKPSSDSQEDEGQVKQRWETLKREERLAKGKGRLLDDVPIGLPAMTRAHKLQKRASAVGFDWSDVSGVFDKLYEELDEVQDALIHDDNDHVEEELGDLLFVMVSICRHRHLDPEKVLRRANQKFERRFNFIEDTLTAASVSLNDASVETMDELWEEAKRHERTP